MTMLTLRIENLATLDNGGPISLQLAGKGAQIGRKVGMDWVLPDPTRHISGHHIDITYEQGAYVLHDVSSNGTFLHGERYRMSEPRVLQNGDRLSVGHYVILVEISAALQPATEMAHQAVAATYAGSGGHNNPAMPPPIQPPMHPPESPPVPHQPDAGTAPEPAQEPFDDVWGDFAGLQKQDSALVQGAETPQTANLEHFAGSPAPRELSVPPQFTAPLADPSLAVQQPQPGQWGDAGVELPPSASFVSPPAPVPQMPAPAATQMPSQTLEQHHPVGEIFTPASLPEMAAPARAAPATPGQTAAPSEADLLLQGFLQGAGLSDVQQLQLPLDELGRMLGRCVRDGASDMIALLQSRSAVKLFISGEDRTMRVANGNNPMKFLTDPERAFEAMFVAPRDGYMTGSDAFRDALSDIRAHQDAVVAALQPALAEMLEGLSPEEIEEAVGGRLVGGNGRKFWAEFTKRWEAGASQGENGMLDAFIKAFSRHYSDAIREGQGK
ncbi:type VI secretion system-associated FHA domain protein TagH [Epibacterium sp. SM1979]|uniref:Type VI secretion system-associated FHA domain protein TagH n=1 Tax=Tritonibacter litoralis TaxID=2662264 RepID=A0A843YLU9_9RHOB|nr:type VI secretion system-associated FHA domain protein TagH [Tritonibacter litoralis]MQQ10625.1 type VI secretion system-associated FHA domain protein TagH [Tritonibacter litoralis]